MKDCKNCANAVFDETWGEYKCKVHKHRIRDVDKYIDCPSHKPKEKEKVRKPKDNTCVCCDDIIPEGRQVCVNCEKSAEEKLNDQN